MKFRALAPATIALALVAALPSLAFAAEGGQDSTTGAVIFLNRHGGIYRPGFDNPVVNTSPILFQAASIPAFGGDDDDWQTVVLHTRTMFGPFNVTVVDEEPPPTTRYIEVAVGGGPEAIGQQPDLLGIAPVYCQPASRSTVFVFSNEAAGDNVLIAQIVAHEVGHAFSLDHEVVCKDPMTYLTGCGEKRFQNRTAACGESSPRACFCSGGLQNSFATIVDAFGARHGPIRLPAAEADANAQPAWVCATPNPRR